MAPLIERDSSRANLRLSGSSSTLEFGAPADSSDALLFPRIVSAILERSTGCKTDLRDRVNTKLICTIGPTNCSTELLKGLIHAGMTAVRFDFTIGDRKAYDGAVKNLATAVRATGKMVATIVDTNGPTSTILLKEGEQVELTAGSQVTLVADPTQAASPEVLPISEPRVVKCVKPGDKIVIGKYLASGSDDASAVLEVVKAEGDSAQCICTEPATVAGQITCMIVNAPRECIPTMQDTDYQELRKWDEPNLVDFVSLSCTRSGEDVKELRKFLQNTNYMQEVQIIAKLESRQGLENFDDILEAADAIMVSRGDLGSSIPVEKLNPIQKYVLHQCNLSAKPAIITRVMDTMQQWPRPTRAEATDVANAVLDGVDCILLGAETVRGQFPVEAARTVLAIAKEAEVVYNNGSQYKKMTKELPTPMPRQMAIASSAVQAANRVGAALIIAITTLGSTPRYAALFRPKVPILSVQLPTLGIDRRTMRWRASGTHKARQTLLSNGIIPVLADPATLDANKSALKVAIDFGKSLGLCQERDNVVVMQRIQNQRVVSMLQVD